MNIITAEMAEKNIEMLGQMFPNCLTEKKNDDGKIVKAIDFDKLRQELADSVVEGPEERYQFTWPDKRNAIRLANAPTTKTLRPCREESVDFDNTQNLYIEGDNLDVLKILRENYLGKVKMIYIDPPYNTGNDFVYNDDFSQTSSEYIAESGQFDSEGNRLVLNTESNGRFHTDWLNMIYPRLKVAKDLLSDDGVIFISIDDNEVANLKKLCDEIFGESNFLTCVTRATGTPTGGGFDGLVNELDYMLIYSRNINMARINGMPMSEQDAQIYDLIDDRGRYLIRSLRRTGGEDRREDRPTMFFSLQAPDGTQVFPIGPTGYESRWICSPAKAKELMEQGLLAWKRNKEGQWQVYQKFYLENRTKAPGNLWNDVEGNKKATRDIRDIFDTMKVFDFPKPLGFLKKCLTIGSSDDSIILDFFSGSATTAHAVMKLNAEDGGNRKYIMVQLPEVTEEKSEAYKAGYKNICEIGKERIRRAGKKVKKEAGLHAQSLDVGFRVLKLDSANEKEVKRTPSEVPVEQGLFDAMLDDMVENIKEDRTPEDLLFQVLPMCNLPLSCKIETKEIDSKCVFVVEDGYLVACFDENINEEVITAIAKMKPYYFVMRDSSLATDNVADNFDQIFNAYSKDTINRIL